MALHRGRKSAAELQIFSVVGLPMRPNAPAHLSQSAAEIWAEVLGSRAAGFFDRASLPLLETYCIASAEYRRLTAIIADTDPTTDLDTYAKLTRLADAHAGRIGAAATKLRLSQQARHDARAGARAADANGEAGADAIFARYRETAE